MHRPAAEAAQARLDFGKFLTSQRERQGLSRQDVVKATKLPSLLVSAIEDGEPEKWPERVFVLSALRAYATAVGLSADETVTRFERLPGSEGAEIFDPHSLERQRRERALGIVLGLALVLSVSTLGLLLRAAWLFATRAAR